MARIRAGWLIMAVALAVPCAARAATTRIAVIADQGNSALAEFVAPSIEAGLSKEAAITLLERALIKKVLAEQKLAAAGLMEPGKAIQAGQILGADMFLLIDAPPPPAPSRRPTTGAQAPAIPAACRIRAIEARTGIMLCSCFAEQETLKSDISGVTSLVDLACRKLSHPANTRRYVALLAFRSEALDRSLNSLTDTLAMLLLSDLANSPDVVVLEREQLDRLRAEKALAAAEVELQTSAVLLKGGLAYGATRDEVVATIGLQSLKGEKEEFLHVKGSPKDLAGLRTEVVRAVAEKLKAELARRAPIAPDAEARIFLKRAQAECGFGPEGITPLVEAAVALDPSEKTLGSAQAIYFRMAQSCIDSIYDSRAAEVEQVLITGLQAFVRFQEVTYLLFRQGLKAWENNGFRWQGSEWLSPWRNFELLPQYAWIVRATRSAQGRALQAEIGEIYLRQYHESLPVMAAMWRKTGQSQNWAEWVGDLLWHSYDVAASDDEWLRLIQEAVGLMEKPPLGVAETPAFPPNFEPLSWSREIFLPKADPELRWEGKNQGAKEVDPKDSDPGVRKVFDWLTRHPDPMIRLYAYSVAFRQHWGCSQDAEKALQILANEFPPVRPDGKENLLVSHYRDSEIFLYACNDYPEILVKYGDAIFRPMLRPEHAALAVSWEGDIGAWLYSLEKTSRFQEAYAIAKELQTTINACSSPHATAKEHVEKDLARLEAKLGIVVPPAPKTVPPDPRAQGFAVQLLAKTGYILDMQPDGDRVVLLELGSERDGSRQWLQLTAVPLQGGKRDVVGEITIKGMGHADFVVPPFLTRDETGQWLACLPGFGIVTFNKDGNRCWTEADGVPSLQIASFACLKGKWYIGTTPGAIIEFDPQTGKSATLCSSRSQSSQNLLDGPPRYEVPFILSDPLRHCLWFGVNHAEGQFARQGLWKFDVVSRQFSLGSATLPQSEFERARWCFDRILLKGLGLYDPATDRLYYLTQRAYHSYMTKRIGGVPRESPWPTRAENNIQYWPIGMFGEKIVCDSQGELCDENYHVLFDWVRIVFFSGDPPIQLQTVGANPYDSGRRLIVECGDAVVATRIGERAIFAIRDKDGAPSFKRLQAKAEKEARLEQAWKDGTLPGPPRPKLAPLPPGISQNKALFACITAGDSIGAQAMLEEDLALLKAQDGSGNEPLGAAVKAHDLDLVKFCLDKGADINHQDRNKDTPLIQAVTRKSREMTLLLIERGANVNIRSGRLKAPLVYAGDWGDADVIAALKKAGAKLTAGDAIAMKDYDTLATLLKEKPEAANGADERGRTPLYMAVMMRDRKAVEMLLEKGADRNGKCGKLGTPMTLATQMGDKEMQQLLAGK